MSPRKTGARTKRFAGRLGPRGLTPIPMEWMRPAVWRLPSGEPLAEFALHSGFLAPLLIGDAPLWRGPAAELAGDAGLRRPALRQARGGLHQ